MKIMRYDWKSSAATKWILPVLLHVSKTRRANWFIWTDEVWSTWLELKLFNKGQPLIKKLQLQLGAPDLIAPDPASIVLPVQAPVLCFKPDSVLKRIHSRIPDSQAEELEDTSAFARVCIYCILITDKLPTVILALTLWDAVGSVWILVE